MIKKCIRIDSISLTYYVFGKGKPILFLHGGRTRALTYRKNIELLAKKYQVIAPDMPCYGNSDVPKTEWDFTDFAHFFDRFLTTLKLKNVIVIGYSFGGGVAFNLATISKNVSRLILVDSAGLAYPQRSGLVKNTGRLLSYAFRPATYPIFYRLAKDFLWYSIIHIKDSLLISKIRRKSLSKKHSNLEKIKVPTLVLWSRDDSLFPLHIAKDLNKGIKNSRLEIVPGNHEWMLFEPNLFYRKVSEFLK